MTNPSASKLQAMGLLAAGVAHDFNNLLSIIEGYSYILQQRIGNVPALQDKISAILNASYRGAELTALLLEFSGPGVSEQKNCELIQAIEYSKPILRALLSSRIELEYQLPQISTIVECSRDQIIEDLIVLASRLGETITGAGSITVSTNITIEEASLFLTNNNTGTYVSKNFSRIFDTSSLQDKTILIVDDEAAILPVLEHQLENLGMKVLKAANADTALLLQRNYPDVIDFLLTDVMMPDVDGVQLAEMISDNRPRMGVVYMTGNSKLNLPDKALVLPKPLRPEALSSILQKALEKVPDA